MDTCTALTSPLVLRSGCKINLTLRITGRLADGRHELDTLFFPLPEPHDELLLEKSGADGGLSLFCEAADIDAEHNTLSKAYALFAAASGFRPGLRGTLRKGVPSGAGLGGGSADAAVLLRWLNTQAAERGQGLSATKLAAIAAAVGADVPFFLQDSACIGTGAGDCLTPCDPVATLGLAGCGLVLLCPSVHVSTAWAYAAFDAWQEQGEKKASLLTAAGETAIEPSSPSGSPLGLMQKTRSGLFWFENSFESPVFAAWPELSHLKARLLREGAGLAVMSGSGASLFALFRCAEKAREVFGRFRDSGVAAYCHVL